jgi:4-amino-4-deoxy-L-arabinose transferase-like glycosyltransferase
MSLAVTYLKNLKQHWKLVAVMAAVLIKGLAWAAVTPPWENHDETVHFAYVQYVAVEHKLPLVDPKLSSLLPASTTEFTLDRFSQEENASLLWSNFYGQGRLEQKALVSEDYAIAYNHILNSNFDTKSDGTTYVSSYPPLYYLLNVLPYYFAYYFIGHSILVRLFAMRVLSILLELILVYFVYLSGIIIYDESFALIAASIVGFQPELSMIFSAVNNDVLVDLMSCVLFYLFLRFQRVNPSWKTATAAGIFMGIALLAKAEAWPVAGVFWICLLIGWLKNHKDWGRAVWILVLSAVIYSPWAAFSWVNYHNPIGDVYNAYGSLYLNGFQFIKQAIEVHRLFGLWVVQFFAERSDSILWYYILALIVVIAVIGTAFILFSKRLRTLPITRSIYQCLVFIIPMVLFLYFIEWDSIQKYHNIMLQGRYLLPVLTPVIIWILLVLDWIAGQRYSKIILSSFMMFMVIFNAASLSATISRYYSLTAGSDLFQGLETISTYISRSWALEISSSLVLIFLYAFFLVILAFIIYFICLSGIFSAHRSEH